VLSGNLQFSQDQVRLSYALIDPANHHELRAGSKQFAAADPFSTQDAVIRDVIALLELVLTPSEQKALQVFGTSHPKAYFLYTEGRGALRNFQEPENVDMAIGLFNQATELDPDYAAAFAAVGQSYWRKFTVTNEKGWLDQAQRACIKAARTDQQLSAAYTCLGVVRKTKGEYEQAVEDFTRAISLEPTNDDAYRERGTTFEAWGHLDEAEQAYLKAIETRPQYWAGYIWLASFYKDRRHDYAKAIDYYYKALAASPANGHAFFSLGGAYIDQGKYDQAITVLEQAVQLRPYWETYYNLGMAYLRARRFAAAVQPFETADGQANDYRARGSLARIYWLTGQSDRANKTYQLAIDQAEKLLQLNPRNSDVHILVSRYYAMLQRKPEALSHVTSALNASQNDPHYLVIAAVVYLRLGDREAALNLMEQAMANGATVLAIRAEPELDVLEADPRYKVLMSQRQRQN
jgi:tetratricopeptide (TPR) repeat protein